MNGEPYSTVREAMRLMQAGDLRAATTAIQHRLNGAAAIDPWPVANAPERDPLEAMFRVVDELPMPAEDAPAADVVTPASAPAEREQFSEHAYTGAAGARRYKLFVPRAYRGQPLPLVVMLHGCTQSPDDFATGTRMNLLAEDRGCLVVYPAQPQTANSSKCWNWFNAGNQQRDRGEPAIIAGLVRELVLTYGLDHERVYVAGFSAGAAMAVILARTHPELFAALGVHSGLPYAAAHDLPSAFAAMHRHNLPGQPVARSEDVQALQGAIPAIVFHGDLDVTVHPCNGEKVASQNAAASGFTAADGSTVTAATVEHGASDSGGHAYTRRFFKDGNGEVVVEHWLVHGAAHAWCGGDPRGSYVDGKGPDASGEMLRFFLDRVRVSGLPSGSIRT